MCFNCFICQATSRPGEPLRRHIVYRNLPERTETVSKRQEDGRYRRVEVVHPARREIASEMPICLDCAKHLAEGMTVRTIRELKPPLPYVPPEPKPAIKPRPADHRAGTILKNGTLMGTPVQAAPAPEPEPEIVVPPKGGRLVRGTPKPGSKTRKRTKE